MKFISPVDGSMLSNGSGLLKEPKLIIDVSLQAEQIKTITINGNLAVEKDGVYTMTSKGAFYYHYYENFYTLAYIDKMWGIMRRESFPEKIVL